MILSLLGCAEKAVFDTPIPMDDTFPRREPTAEERARYEAAAAYSRDHDGFSLMVLDGSDVVFEDFPVPAEVPHHLFSGTKSFGCLIASAAVADGVLSLDERVLDVVPSFDDEHPEHKADVTVAHLLSFTSGLDQAWWSLTRDGLLAEQRVEDKPAVALSQRVKQAPGTEFEYGSAHLWAFDAVMGPKVGDPLDYLRERLLDPIGFRTAGWIEDPSGHPALPYGAFTTANEWAKVGVLLRDDGVWQGERLVPEGAFSRCFQGSTANPGYGLTFWLNRSVTDDTDLGSFDTMEDWRNGDRLLRAEGPDDLVAAAGAQDQRLYVIPSRGLVIVRQGGGDRSWEDGEFLDLVLGP